MLIKIVDDDQVFAKKIESMVYDGFKDIFLDYSIDCITSHFEDRYFEKGDIFFLDIDLKDVYHTYKDFKERTLNPVNFLEELQEALLKKIEADENSVIKR